MSDVLFRYLLMARRRDRSLWRRLLFADEQLLEAGVEQLVETAAARIAVTSQHERVNRHTVTRPASRRHRVTFYDVPRPNRPVPESFERRSEEFPLGPTLQVYTCPRCRGAGEIRCRRCRGRGAVRCGYCGGRGRRGGRRCVGCSGAGSKTCLRCSGRGRETCYECRGEGELASWEVEVYRWLIETRSGEEYPLQKHPGRLRRAFDRWLDVDPDRVASLEPAAAAEHLGYQTPEALEVAARADALRQRLEEEVRGLPDRYLFHRSDRSLAPVGYTIVRLAGHARSYWLVGRGERALEVSPWPRLDGRKWLGWLGLPFGGTMAYEGVVQTYDLALAGLQLLSTVSAPWLAGGAGLGWLLLLAGVRRVLYRPPPVLTVGLFPAGGPTTFLTCLAYLGSYSGRLRVLDRAYDTQLERLLGAPRPDRQSESLTVELRDGRKVRLVEVADPARLPDDQLRLVLEALDGVLVLADTRRPAGELEARIRALGEIAPALATVVLDPAGELSAEPPSALPLEALRRAFVARDDAAWDDWFDRLWEPIGRLLETAASDKITQAVGRAESSAPDAARTGAPRPGAARAGAVATSEEPTP